MKTYISLPKDLHNTLEEKLIEEVIETRLKTKTVCARHDHNAEAFDQICECDAIVVVHKHIDSCINWAVKIASILHKQLYVLDRDTNRLTELKPA